MRRLLIGGRLGAVVAISEVTDEAVVAAIKEFDQLGRDAFLKLYGFGPARGYFLVHEGRQYDSKAILGAAHSKISPLHTALTSADFSGGEKATAKVLRGLGFKVATPTEATAGDLPYEHGQTYHRQRDIHQVFAGQERGGISTPAGVPFVFLFTGESGGQYGYTDGWRQDGTFSYTGEGQRGDMQFVSGNKAIRDHVHNGRDLLLFEALPTKGLYRFVDRFACVGFQFGRGADLEGNERSTIVFTLLPASSEPQPVEKLVESYQSKSIDELRALAYQAASPSAVAAEGGSPRKYYQRSADVRAYVLRRSKGICECCDKAAPFSRKDGAFYLEPHHTRRVADGGPDDPRTVAAVCPNCHREIHHGSRGEFLNSGLVKKLLTIEGSPP